MARKHLWIRRETTKVESKYHDNALLLSLRAIALEYAANAREFSLTIGELFYNCIYSIDQIKSIEEKQERLAYCSALWDEVYEYILDLADGNEEELKDAASLIVITVGQCLYAADKLKYFDEVMALYAASEKRNRGKGQQMLGSLKPLVDERVNAKVRTWLSEYISSNVFISDDIEDEVLGMRNGHDAFYRSTSSNGNLKQPLTNLIFNPRLFDSTARLERLRSEIACAISMGSNHTEEEGKKDYTLNLLQKSEWYYLMQAFVEADVTRGVPTVPDLYKQMKAWFPEVAVLEENDAKKSDKKLTFTGKLTKSISNEKAKWKEMGTDKSVPLKEMVAKNQASERMKPERCRDLYKAAYTGLCVKLKELKAEIEKERSTR